MKKLLFAVLTTAFVLPLSVFAQVALPTSVQANIDQVTALDKQISALQTQRATALSEITQSLKQGSQGDQVKILQALLAADASIYPEGLVSGYYGSLTAKAVKRFQEKNGFEGVGFLGPKTRGLLNQLLHDTPIVFSTASTTATSTVFVVRGDENKKGGDNKNNQKGDNMQREDMHLCAMVAPGHLIAPGWLRKNKGEYHPVVPPCQFIPKGIEDKIENDEEDHRGQNDKTAPIITGVSVSVATSSAVATWTTNEVSNSSVSFGTTAAYGSLANGSALVTNHSVILAGLTPSTLYNYQVKSIDMSGNTATSSNLTFTTSTLADITAPTISSIVSTVASTTASVSWTTSEAASSRFYFGTTTPLTLVSATLVNDPMFLTTHTVPLTGLTASTTYHFLVNAVDIASNSATSTEQAFTTTN